MPKGVYQHKPNQGFQRGDKNPSSSTERRLQISSSQIGRKLSDEWKTNIGKSIKKLGIRPPSAKGKIWSKEVIMRRVESLKKTWDKKGRKVYSRPKHQGTEYRIWRKSVYDRDNYTCQICGTIGGALNADHIKPWCLFPELRFDINNGRTLCVPCHKATDTFGPKARKYYANNSTL
jgi:hypothetical protein